MKTHLKSYGSLIPPLTPWEEEEEGRIFATDVRRRKEKNTSTCTHFPDFLYPGGGEEEEIISSRPQQRCTDDEEESGKLGGQGNYSTVSQFLRWHTHTPRFPAKSK